METNNAVTEHDHFHADCCDPSAGPSVSTSIWGMMSKQQWLTLIVSGGLLLILWPVNSYVFEGKMPGWLSFSLYLIAYLPVALPVWSQAFRYLARKDIFNEFMLMGIATLGAFYVSEYAEGVAVMLFYTIGEWAQEAAVVRSRRSIKELIGSRPDHVKKVTGDIMTDTDPESVEVGDILQFKVGERISFDGTLVSKAPRSLDTSSLTGEFIPRDVESGEEVLAGMVPLNEDIQIKVSRPLSESTLSRMMYLVEEAASRKAPSENLIRKLAGYYTPAVFFAAVAICLGPALFVDNYEFNTWLYRSLVFLVISCPCALVISIPLGFYGGLGAASHRGILIKGAQFLDTLNGIKTVFFDKTGTLTTGKMKVESSEIQPGFSDELMKIVSAVEHGLDHPVSVAISAMYPDAHKIYEVSDRRQLRGMGVEAKVDGVPVIIGNLNFMKQQGIQGIESVRAAIGEVYASYDGKYAGKIKLGDSLKPEAAQAILDLKRLGIKHLGIVSGDSKSNVANIAQNLGISDFHGGLLPDDKLEFVTDHRTRSSDKIAFVGEGFNDAPVLAAADVGIAMGQLGADASLESADIIIQSDNLDRLPTVFKISRATRNIIWQNITFALGVKVLVLVLGSLGMATLWQAVFADVGVALIAIANAVRLHHKRFD